MNREGTLEKVMMLGAAFIFLSLLFLVLYKSDVRAMIIAGWLITAALAIIWIWSVVGWISKKVGHLWLIMAVIVMIITILGSNDLIQRAIPYCGDDVCTPKECRDGCTDCTADQCQDGYCQLKFEDCASQDCACGSGMVCAPQRKSVDERGCYRIECGDGLCDGKEEDRYNCCTDCGCQEGYKCERNICYFQPPRISFTPYVLSQELSATTIAANPSLTDRAGKTNPIMAVTLSNSVSKAIDTHITFAIPGFVTKTVSVGTMHANMELPVLWYLEHEEAFLSVTDDVTPNITVTISYTDMQDVAHTSTWSYPFTVLERNSIDEYGNIAFFVTPDDVSVRGSTTRAIWKEVQDLVDVGPSGGRFPAETLERGTGSPEDIALVLASALIHAGIRTYLVESDRGLYVRLLDRDAYIMLDTSKIDEDFNNAITTQPGYAVHEIEQVWRARNATVLSLR